MAENKNNVMKRILLAIPLFMLLINSVALAWLDGNFTYRIEVNKTNNNDTEIIPVGYVHNYTLDHANLVSLGKALYDGNDTWVSWLNASTEQWIDRNNENDFNLTNTTLAWKNQEAIAVNGTSTF